MFKKILSSILLSVFLFVTLATPFAQSVKAEDAPTSKHTWYNPDYFQWMDRVYNPDNEDEIFGERYTQAQVDWIIYGFFTFLWNMIGDPNINWCVINVLNDTTNVFEAALIRERLFLDCGDEVVAWVFKFINPLSSSLNNQSTLASESHWSAVFTSRRISTYGFIKQSFSRLRPVSEVSAAEGFGYSAVDNMISNIWGASRDISYFLLTIVMILMAFMIMFRTKISPQVVITVQSALPKVVIGLVLITFSFAIAGFLIDLTYVVIGLLSMLLTTGTNNTLSNFSWNDMFKAFTQRSVITHFIVYWIQWIVSALFASFSFIWAIGIGNVFNLIIVIIAWVFILFALIVISFKSWLMLIKNYISILLQIAFGPLIIVGGVAGIGPGFGGWLKNLFAALIVYPAVALLLFLSFLFLAPSLPDYSSIPGIGNFFNTLSSNLWAFDIKADALGGSTDFWEPPLTLGSGAFELLMCFASLTVLALIPKTVDIVKSYFSGKPFGYGTAVGEAAAGPAILANYGVKTVKSISDVRANWNKLKGGTTSHTTT